MAELRKIGVRLTAEGVNQYKDDLRSAGKEARLMSQETKIAMLELGEGASSADKFQTQLKGLERQYDVQKNKLKTLTNSQKDFTTSLDLTQREIKDTSSAFKESSRETDRLENNYRQMGKALGYNATETKKAKAEWQASAQETKDLGKSLNNLEKDQKSYTKELDKMPGKMNAAKVSMGELSNEMQQLNTEYIKNGGELADLSNKLTTAGDKVKTFSSGVQSVGSTLTTSVTLPLVAMGTAALTVGIRFEQQMSRVGAIAGATGSDLAALTDQAKELGASTAFSAGEVAQGMENMASAGFTVTEIMSSMAGVLDLAAVSGGDVALASEAMSTAINAFGLEAADAGHVANVFARAAADTNAETADMAEALKYAAPPAANLGMSLEDTAAAIGIMSDAGIKGSSAGTALRASMTRLAKPTKQSAELIAELGLEMFDAQGNIKPMSDLVGELEDGLSGMTREQKAAALATIFGQEAMSGMMTLIEAGPDKVDELSKSFENSAGSAEEMATVMQDNVAGTIDEMMGALETAGIELTEALAPAITEAAEAVTELVGSFNELDDETQKQIIQWVALAAAAGPVLSVIGSMGQGVGTLIKLGGSTTKMLGGMKASLSQSGGAAKVAAGSVDDLALAAAGASGAKGVGGLTLALGGALPWVAGITLAVGAGYGAWKLWGEGAYEAGQRTQQWGTDVGEEADKALDNFLALSDEASLATESMAYNIEDGTTRAIEAYSGMSQSIIEDVKSTIAETEEGLAGLPESVRAIVSDSLTEGIAEQTELISEVETIQSEITKIYEAALAENREVSDKELAVIENYHTRLAEIRSETLQLSAEEQRQVQSVMANDLKTFSTEQLAQRQEMLAKEKETIQKGYDEQAQLLEDSFTDGTLSRQEYNAAMDALNKEEINDLLVIGAEYAKIWEERGDIPKATQEKMLADMGLTLEQVKSYLAKEEIALENAAGNMIETSIHASEEMRKANDAWNSSEWLDKEGNLKTNAVEMIQDASQSEEGWNNLQFIMHNAELDTNSMETIMEALMANGMWWEMDFPSQFAGLETNAGTTATAFLRANYDWENLEYEDQMAILNSNSSETLKQVLIDVGVWENLSLVEKEMIIATNAGRTVKDALVSAGTWNELTTEQKELVLTSNSVEVAWQAIEAMNLVPELKYSSIVTDTNAPLTKVQLDAAAQSADILNGKAPYIPTGTSAPLTAGQLRYATDEAKILDGQYPYVPTGTNALYTENGFKYATFAAQTLDSQAPYVPVSDNSSNTKGNLDATTQSAQTLNSQSPYIPVTDNSSNTKGNLSATTSAAQTLNRQNPFVTAGTNAPTIRGEVESARSSAKDEEFTITGWFKKAGDWLGFATGTPATPYDGTFNLGDGGKREPYLTPTGHFGVSGSSDELHNLPKGTRIWPSRQSFKTSARSNDYLKQYMDFIPKFATGGTIQNPYDGYSGLVGEAGPEIFQIAQGKVSITPISAGQRTKVLEQQGGTSNADMNETNALLQALIQLVAQGQVIQMDGKEVGRSIYDVIDGQMNRNYKRGSIMNMKGGG